MIYVVARLRMISANESSIRTAWERRRKAAPVWTYSSPAQAHLKLKITTKLKINVKRKMVFSGIILDTDAQMATDAGIMYNATRVRENHSPDKIERPSFHTKWGSSFFSTCSFLSRLSPPSSPAISISFSGSMIFRRFAL